MKYNLIAAPLAIGMFASLAATAAAVRPSASDSSPARPRATERAQLRAVQIASHGALMNAMVYVASGVGRHPAVILLHGLPGYERNLDLAQDMRRAGWDVLYFDYRGSWGTHGNFSFAHSIEDTAAAVAYLRRPDVASELRLDPDRIVLIGHSMGGFMAVQDAAGDPSIEAFATLSAVDFGGRAKALLAKHGERDAIGQIGAALGGVGMAPLSGCTPESLARDLVRHAANWSFQAKVDALKDRSVLIVTSDDGMAAENEAFAGALRKAGDRQVSTVHLPTDHVYSDQRLELSKLVLQWLASLPKQGAGQARVRPLP